MADFPCGTARATITTPSAVLTILLNCSADNYYYSRTIRINGNACLFKQRLFVWFVTYLHCNNHELDTDTTRLEIRQFAEKNVRRRRDNVSKRYFQRFRERKKKPLFASVWYRWVSCGVRRR